MVFDVAVLHGGGVVPALHPDQPRLLNSGLIVAFFHVRVLEDVVREVLVQLRRARLHRLLRVEHERQFLVFDPQRAHALHGRDLVFRDDDGHIVSVIAHMPVEQMPVGHVLMARIHRPRMTRRWERMLRHVEAGQHLHHAVDLFGGGLVHGFDQPVRDLRVLDADIERLAGHQIGAASAADSTFRCGISELVMQCLGILFKRLVEISNLYQYQRIRILCAQCGILLPNRACLYRWHLQRFFKAKHGIGAVQIGPHGFYTLLAQGIVPILLFRGFPGREHILINFLHPVSVQKLCGHSFDALPIVCNGVLGKRPHHILRRIHEEIYDLPGQLFPLIFRHGRPVGIGEEFVLGDQFSDAFGRLRPFQRDLGIGGRDTAVAELNALATGVGEIVIPAALTAVLAVIILEVFFTLGLILVRGVKSVHAKAIVGAAVPSTQHLVDLIGGNNKLPVGSKPVGNGKMKRLPL